AATRTPAATTAGARRAARARGGGASGGGLRKCRTTPVRTGRGRNPHGTGPRVPPANRLARGDRRRHRRGRSTAKSRPLSSQASVAPAHGPHIGDAVDPFRRLDADEHARNEGLDATRFPEVHRRQGIGPVWKSLPSGRRGRDVSWFGNDHRPDFYGAVPCFD